MLEEGWGHSLLLINYQEVEGRAWQGQSLGTSAAGIPQDATKNPANPGFPGKMTPLHTGALNTT